jgi:hypothetical protein
MNRFSVHSASGRIAATWAAAGVFFAAVPASAEQADPATQARANARLALEAALSELQQTAGPDRKVTARSGILGAGVARPNLTGVWRSWEIDPDNPPTSADYGAGRESKFLRWLVSSADSEAPARLDFARQAPDADGSALLMGGGTLGDGAPASGFVFGDKVAGETPGNRYAWAVLDEGVKVRINTPFQNQTGSTAAATMELGAGERPGTEFIDGLGALGRNLFEAGSPEYETLARRIDPRGFIAASAAHGEGLPAALKGLTHDVTYFSSGVFCDVAHGGLKNDFHLLVNGNLSRSHRGKRIFGNYPDPAPTWDAIRNYATIHRNLLNHEGAPLLKIQVPRLYRPYYVRSGNITPNPGGILKGPLLVPTVARVQMVFSIVSRDLHGGWDDRFEGTGYKYMLHLVYSPVVTLHNPFNVALEFDSMKLEFKCVPFAVQFFRNGKAMSTKPVPLDRMFMYFENGQTPKLFSLTLVSGTEGQPIRLQPGEVRVFGPDIDPDSTFGDGRNSFFDWRSNLSNDITCPPRWFSSSNGYDVNWLVPRMMSDGPADDPENGRYGGVIALKANDRIEAKVWPRSISASKNKFQVACSIKSGRRKYSCGVISVDYQSKENLETLTSAPITMPSPTQTNRIYESNETILMNYKRIMPIALFSLQGRTTNTAHYPGKPWCFAHANSGVSAHTIGTDPPASGTHEINLSKLRDYGGEGQYLETDPWHHGYFISGDSLVNGARFGVLYDVPLGPVQNFSSLNGVNWTSAVGDTPRFAQPIGNSWAHPLISPDKCREPDSGDRQIDHSYLANLAFYDHFYFSGFADRTGPFGDDKSATDLADAFARGHSLDDPRMLLYRPDSGVAKDLPALVASSDGYRKVGAWQMMNGAFNVNSTSVQAWKAMLASIHDADAMVNQVDPDGENSELEALPDPGEGKVRISRFRLPASKGDAPGMRANEIYWLGAREYSDEELEHLAEKIVEQVRERGPFLSMGDFVNRHLDASNLDHALRGALQQAIDESGLNTLPEGSTMGRDIPLSEVSDLGYRFPEAAAGPSHQGAPGFLCQADLLAVLGNAAAVRSDTFTIRAYGEVADDSGNPLGKAWCEAVVQRVPDWFDPSDEAATPPDELSSEANRTRGRRFRLVSFRWLSEDDV